MTIGMSKELTGTASLQLRDITGQLVKEVHDGLRDGYLLDVHGLGNGVYMMHLQVAPGKTYDRKVVVNQ